MFCEREHKDCYVRTGLDFLVEVSRIISRSEDLYKSLESLLAELCKFLGAQYSIITILDSGSDRIVIGAAYGLTQKEKNRGIYHVGEGVIGRVVETGEPAVIPDVSKSKEFLNRTGLHTPKEKGFSLAFLCVPIRLKNGMTGTLSIHKLHEDQKDFAYELSYLYVFGTFISQHVAIRRRHIEEMDELRNENTSLRNSNALRPDNIIGNSAAMRDVYELVQKVAQTDTTVMIRGESGVGKELIAEAIHKASARSGKPFVKVNCSALPENLIESELFGHEKGSFTGADSTKQGRFEAADGGTIFLDEVGDVPLSMQVKLLRVLQQRQFEHLGSTKTISVNVRIITATNRKLEDMMEKGDFRGDLYYRIHVFPVYVPPLRERKADIPLLVDHFIDRFNRRNGIPIKRITGGALDMLMMYSWPGNIRELENVIERATILSTDGVIHSYNLPPSLQTASATETAHVGTLEAVLARVEKQMIIDTLIEMNGSITKASAQLGVTERIMGLRLKRYEIAPHQYKHFRHT
ncbi:MAG: sigma 54-interacting transcriptional regulator [Tannerellaceae bacterium]|jgi:Nif-specific regulatory protein|nr:sigma 54-interacting transcriptional regulator [Tannerellaceae bacterium]